MTVAQQKNKSTLQTWVKKKRSCAIFFHFKSGLDDSLGIFPMMVFVTSNSHDDSAAWFYRGMESQIWPLWLEIHTDLRVDTWNLGRLRADYSLRFFLVGWACIVCFFCLFEKGWLCKCILSWVFLPPRLQWCLIIFVPFAIRMRPTYLCLHNDFHRWQCVFVGGKRERHSQWGRMGKILSDWHHMIPRLILWDVAPTLHKIGRFSSIPRVFLVPEMPGFSEASGWTSG